MRLLEITLSVVDLEATRYFYCGVLGLRELESHWTERVSVQVGDTRLMFQLVRDNSHPRYHFAFDVPANRFDQAIDWLRERGGPITDTDGTFRFKSSEKWNAEMVYFTDPQGNILELIARHDRQPPTGALQRLPDKDLAGLPFSANELISVSEIGIGVDSVVDSVAHLQTRMPGLPIYDGEGSDQFTAVGDIHGLLIVVRRGRIWFPNTSVPADHQPLEIQLELEVGRRYRLSAPPYPISTSPVA